MRYVHQRTVERAWTSMTAEPRQYRLTPDDRIVCSDNPDDGELVGVYDNNALLEDFRVDVRFTWKLRKALRRAA